MMVYLSCMVIAKDFNAAQQALTASKLMHLATDFLYILCKAQ
jgi:hypothetical protein